MDVDASRLVCAWCHLRYDRQFLCGECATAICFECLFGYDTSISSSVYKLYLSQVKLEMSEVESKMSQVEKAKMSHVEKVAKAEMIYEKQVKIGILFNKAYGTYSLPNEAIEYYYPNFLKDPLYSDFQDLLDETEKFKKEYEDSYKMNLDKLSHPYICQNCLEKSFYKRSCDKLQKENKKLKAFLLHQKLNGDML